MTYKAKKKTAYVARYDKESTIIRKHNKKPVRNYSWNRLLFKRNSMAKRALHPCRKE